MSGVPTYTPSTGEDEEIDYKALAQSYLDKIKGQDPETAGILQSKLDGQDPPQASWLGGIVHAISPASSSGGWKGGLVSDVWNVGVGGALRGFGKALTTTPVVKEPIEMLMRTNSAVMEPFVEEASRGEKGDPFWEDIYQGLMGYERTSGADVLASMKVHRGGGFFSDEEALTTGNSTAKERKQKFDQWRDHNAVEVLGFGLDVLADPTTYFLPGGKAAVGTVAAAKGAENITRAGVRASIKSGVGKGAEAVTASAKVVESLRTLPAATQDRIALLTGEINRTKKWVTGSRKEFVDRYGTLTDDLEVEGMPELTTKPTVESMMGDVSGVDKSRLRNGVDSFDVVSGKGATKKIVHSGPDGKPDAVLELHLDDAGKVADAHVAADRSVQTTGIPDKLLNMADDKFGLLDAEALPQMTRGGAALAYRWLNKRAKYKETQAIALADQQYMPTIEDAVRKNAKAQGLPDEFANDLAGRTANGATDKAIKGLDDIEQTIEGWAGKETGDAVHNWGSLGAVPDNKVFWDPFGNKWSGKQLKQFVREGAKASPKKTNPKWVDDLMSDPMGGTKTTRRAAAALGGARWEASAPWIVRKWAQRNGHPFMSYRYTFGLMEYPAEFPMRSVSRFMRGNAWRMKMESLAADPNVPFFLKDIDIWKSTGRAALKDHMLATGRLATFEKYFGNKAATLMMPASERVGHLTEGLTYGQGMVRKFGVVGAKVRDVDREARQRQKQFKQDLMKPAEEWTPAIGRLNRDPNKDVIKPKMIEYLEGNDEILREIPDYLHKPLDQMREGFKQGIVRLHDEGVDIGDLTQAHAARMAQDTYKLVKAKLRALDEEEDALKQHLDGGPGVTQEQHAAAQVRQGAILRRREELRKVAKETGKGTKASVQKKLGLGDDLEKRMAQYNKWYEELGGAPRPSQPSRYFHFMFTPQARAMLQGEFDPSDPLHVGKLRERKTELAAKERTLVMGRKEAEALIRKDPKFAAVAKLDKIIEDDPFNVYSTWVQQSSNMINDSVRAKGVRSVAKEVGAYDNGVFFKGAPKDLMEKLKNFDDGNIAGAQELEQLMGQLHQGLPKVPGELSPDAQALYSQVTHGLNAMKAKLLGIDAPMEQAMHTAASLEGTNHQFFKQLEVPGLEDLTAHPYMAAEIHRAYKGLKDPKYAAHRAWRLVNQHWKAAATIYWYGFHARNNVGAFFNNFMSRAMDVVDDYRVSDRALLATRSNESWVHDTVRLGGKEKGTEWKNVTIDGTHYDRVTYKQLGQLMTDNGILGSGGLALGDFYNHLPKRYAPLGTGSHHKISNWVTEQFMQKNKARPTLPGLRISVEPEKFGRVRVRKGSWEITPHAFMTRLHKQGAALALGTENTHRAAAFVGGLIESGGDTKAARAYTMMRHGDYEELTEWENNIKDVIPFFKWMRTNVPYQVRNLVERPGQTVLPYEKLKNSFVNDEERKDVPTWMRDEFLLGVKGDIPKDAKDAAAWYMVADLPMQDLYMGYRDFFGGFMPLVKPFVENTVTKEQTFSGIPLEGKPEKLAGWMHATHLDSVLEEFGIGERDVDGDITVTDKQMNVLNILPLFSRNRNFISGDPDRKELRAAAFISMMAGVSLRDVDYKSLNDDEAAILYEEIRPVYDHLKDLGYELPSGGDVADFPQIGKKL